MVKSDDERVRVLVMRWIDRAQIDYSDLYARLYIAYNAWFRRVTRSSIDREAINRLMERFVIWDDYLQRKTLVKLQPIVKEIATLTKQYPLTSSSKRWDGVVKNADDWQGLIHYWYEVRCVLFHGSLQIDGAVSKRRVRLAYASLNCFMLEITQRMKRSFNEEDARRLKELTLLMNEKYHHEDFTRMRQKLHEKFIAGPDLWNVDMTRTP